MSGHHQPTSESVPDGFMVACIENFRPQPRPPPLTKHYEIRAFMIARLIMIHRNNEHICAAAVNGIICVGINLLYTGNS